MKKLIGIALVLAVLAVLAFGSVALADPTDVDIKWGGGAFDSGGYPVDYGAGYIGATVTAGDDATTTFSTFGDAILGRFTATDKDDDPYTYGVDTFDTYITAEVLAYYGGINYYTQRNDSGPYGPAGQNSTSSVYVEDGWGAMATGSNTNYARLRDCQYGDPTTTNGVNIEANAAYYEIIRELVANNGDTAYAWGMGNGVAQLQCFNAEAWNNGSNHLRLGWGCGCSPYPAYVDYHAVGSGYFETFIEGSSQATIRNLTTSGATGGALNWSAPGGLDWSGLPAVTALGDGSDHSCYLQYINTFVTGFDYDDWGIGSQK
jgi:hypothetical protein